MNEQLETFAAQVREQAEEASRLLGAGDELAAIRRPAPDRWSVAEHIAHVSVTDGPYLEQIDAALEAGRRAGRSGEGPFRGRLLGNWFARLMEPPPRPRLKTLGRLEPPEALAPGTVLEEFEGRCRAIRESVVRADGLDLDRISIRSPYLWLLRMPVFSAYRVLLAHGRRHLWLAREARDAVRAPTPNTS